ncbi:MAG TPA: sugar phosphate nucleotidyltransferase [Acidimicrobiales bacterium]|nr:sugar phosphate nucleotidyltransferase [Acidimicrobiales bacterium]
MSTTSELAPELTQADEELLAEPSLTPARLAQRAASMKGTANEAIILAGGKGLRLRPFTTLIPKPLVPIGEHYSVLEVVMRQLAWQGFSHATLTVGHLGQLVQAYAGDGSQWGIDISYLSEDSPLGTMGPVLRALDDLPAHFVVMNADVLTNLDYSDLLRGHISSGAPLTVATQRRTHKVDFGVLDVRERRIRGFSEKPVLTYDVNMGIYAVSKEALRRYEPGLPYGFDELICDLIKRGEHPATYEFDGYWLDIGRPDDYDKANTEFELLKKELLPSA